MAIQSVTLKFSVKKSDGQPLTFTDANGAQLSELQATATTHSAAGTLIAAKIQTSLDKAQGNLDDQQAASNAFGS